MIMAEIPAWNPTSFAGLMLSATAFGVLGICLLLAGFKLFDWITPKIDVQRELAENKNMAVAIVVASLILGVSILLARVIGA